MFYVVQRQWPVIEGERKEGIIPAITEGHMGAPVLYAHPDYDVFKQDKTEKGRVLTAKLHHKEELQAYYGKDWKNHLNIPARSIPSFHLTF